MENIDSDLFEQAVFAYENYNMDCAIDIFTRLANGGHPYACQYLGLIYKTGDGVQKDLGVSRLWYAKHRAFVEERSFSNDVYAMLELGKIYQYGDNVDSDCEKAFSLISRSAERGCADAQLHLAMIFQHAWCGCSQDHIKYEYWLCKAAENGHAEALYLRGLSLIRIEGRHEDGMDMIEIAANKKFWPAQQWFDARRCD